MKRFSTLLACGLLWLAGIAASVAPAAAQIGTPPGAQPLAQSAQLKVLATLDDEWLTLHIQRVGTQTPLETKAVTVLVGGHAMPVKAKADGSFVLPVKQLGTTTTPTLDIIVAHDGIREILSGQLTLPQAAAPVAGSHNQGLWWILNIALVFAVAMYFANRKKKPVEPE